jgi:hypothetical protein
MGMFKADEAPPAPDYSGLIQASREAAEKNYQLGREQLDWARDQWSQQKEMLDPVLKQMIETQSENSAWAKEQRHRYRTVYQPLEDQFVEDAKTYDSAGRKDLAIGAAQGQVAEQYEGARQQALQRLEGYGIDPSSTRSGALDIGVRTARAAAAAGAGTAAGNRVDDQAIAMRAAALNLGQQNLQNALASDQTGTQAGNSAVTGSNTGLNTGGNIMGNPTAWTGLGNAGLSSWLNGMNSQYNAQLGEFKANQEASSGIGSLLGAAAGIGLGMAGLPGSSVGGKLLGKMFDFAGGGPVEGIPTSGPAVPPEASPSGGRAIDDVPARLTAGEFVMPEDATSWYGEKFLTDLIVKARKGQQAARSHVGTGGQPRAAIPARPTFVSQGIPA